MAQNEVAEVAGSCGHGGDDAACKCWGVIRDDHTWMSLSCSAGWCANYVAAYDEALQYRRGAMGATHSFRVRHVSHMMPPVMCPAPCKDCGASKCDCNQPIWSYRFRSPTRPNGAWRGGHDHPIGAERREIVRLHASDAPHGVERGPIQRVTEPPYEFLDRERATMTSDDVLPGYELRWKIGNPRPQRGLCALCMRDVAGALFEQQWLPMRSEQHDPACPYFGHDANAPFLTSCGAPATQKCDLEWCEAQTTQGFCSPRCADYAVRQRVIVLRMTDFEKRTETKCGGQLWAELKWAREKTGHELVELQRSWRAVQHEAAVGDERFFKLLGDDE